MRINFRRLLPVFAIATGVALVTATSAFKEAPKTKGGDPTYYFAYVSGNAADPANWQSTSDGTRCSGNGKSCKILLPEDYVNTSTTPVSIDASTLPSNLLPTVNGTSGNKVPDPSRTDIYLGISNQNP